MIKQRECDSPNGRLIYSLLSRKLTIENELELPTDTEVYDLEVQISSDKPEYRCIECISGDRELSKFIFDRIADGGVMPFEIDEIYLELIASL